MGLAVITLPLKGIAEQLSFAEFDKEKYEQEKGVTLGDKPIYVEHKDTKIILIYECSLEERKEVWFSA